jgi:hypothetical protein
LADPNSRDAVNVAHDGKFREFGAVEDGDDGMQVDHLGLTSDFFGRVLGPSHDHNAFSVSLIQMMESD